MIKGYRLRYCEYMIDSSLNYLEISMGFAKVPNHESSMWAYETCRVWGPLLRWQRRRWRRRRRRSRRLWVEDRVFSLAAFLLRDLSQRPKSAKKAKANDAKASCNNLPCFQLQTLQVSVLQANESRTFNTEQITAVSARSPGVFLFRRFERRHWVAIDRGSAVGWVRRYERQQTYRIAFCIWELPAVEGL